MSAALELARNIMLYLGDVVSGTEPGEDPRLDHVTAMIAESAPQLALTDALPELPTSFAQVPRLDGTLCDAYTPSQMRGYAMHAIEARNQQGDAEDAERYRVIRDSADVSFDAAVWIVTDSGARINVTCGARSELDRMADAAIEQRKADKKGGSDANQA